MWQVLLSLGIPLALYSSLSTVFKVMDTFIAAFISPLSISTIAYLSQIGHMLAAIGNGLAIGAAITVSSAIGAGDYLLVKRRVSTLFFLCAGMTAAMLALLPFTSPLLRLMGTPEEFIGAGAAYFAVTIADIAIGFLNTSYIAIERARGDSKTVVMLSAASVAIKISLMLYFVFGLGGDIVMIAAATLISDLFITAACIYKIFFRGRGEALSFSPSAVDLSAESLSPMLRMSAPVMVEKSSFFLGKVIVNSMATVYGSLTVGALGISNNVSGITTSFQSGFQDAGAAVISQNVGAGNLKRAKEAFYKLSVIGCTVGLIGYLITAALLPQIAVLLAKGDPVFAQMIAAVCRYELIGLVPLGFFAAVMALLYGFGRTKITFYINAARLFVLRVPVLWALQRFTSLGAESVGVVMMVSNVGTGVLGLFAAAWLLGRTRKAEG